MNLTRSCIVVLVFHVSCALSSKMKTLDYSNIIWPISQEFKMKNLTLVKSPSFQDVALFKMLITNNLTVSIEYENSLKVRKRIPNQQNSFIFMSSDQFHGNFTEEFHAYVKFQSIAIVVISEDQLFENIMSSLNVQINKEVYLFKISSSQLFETYHVNNVHVKRLLGHFKPKSRIFTWEENVDQNLITRRSDFQGLILKSGSNLSGVRLKLDLSYMKKTAPYYSENDTYLVNGYTSGIYQDILEIIQNRLNFSVLLYLRGDRVWGNGFSMPNGTKYATGLIGDLYYNRVDMALAGFYIKHSRGLVIDYFPPLEPFTIGIYTPIIGDSKSYNFEAFLSIFSKELWIVILLTAFIIASMKLFLLHMHGSVRIIDIIVFLWTSFIANFGGVPTSTSIDSKRSYRILLFSSLIGGVVIMVMFRSRLTAELSVTIKKYPFTDMESFSETNWR